MERTQSYRTLSYYDEKLHVLQGDMRNLKLKVEGVRSERSGGYIRIVIYGIALIFVYIILFFLGGYGSVFGVILSPIMTLLVVILSICFIKNIIKCFLNGKSSLSISLSVKFKYNSIELQVSNIINQIHSLETKIMDIERERDEFLNNKAENEDSLWNA